MIEEVNGQEQKKPMGVITITCLEDGSVVPTSQGKFNVPNMVFCLENMKIDLIMQMKQAQMMAAMQGVQPASGPVPPFRKSL